MRRRVTVLIAVTLLALAAVAVASTKTIADKKGDSRKGYPDIKSATVKTTANRVTATIVSYNAFAKNASPCITLTTNTQPQNGDGYVICGDAKLQNFNAGGAVGTVRLQHPDAKTAVYLIGRKQIGNPRSFTWLAQVRGYHDSCIQKYHDVCDIAPNSAKRVKQSF